MENIKLAIRYHRGLHIMALFVWLPLPYLLTFDLNELEKSYVLGYWFFLTIQILGIPFILIIGLKIFISLITSNKQVLIITDDFISFPKPYQNFFKASFDFSIYQNILIKDIVSVKILDLHSGFSRIKQVEVTHTENSKSRKIILSRSFFKDGEFAYQIMCNFFRDKFKVEEAISKK